MKEVIQHVTLIFNSLLFIFICLFFYSRFTHFEFKGIFSRLNDTVIYFKLMLILFVPIIVTDILKVVVLHESKSSDLLIDAGIVCLYMYEIYALSKRTK